MLTLVSRPVLALNVNVVRIVLRHTSHLKTSDTKARTHICTARTPMRPIECECVSAEAERIDGEKLGIIVCIPVVGSIGIRRRTKIRATSGRTAATAVN